MLVPRPNPSTFSKELKIVALNHHWAVNMKNGKKKP
jgi:hypothetical protein